MYYASHVPAIAEGMRSDPAIFARGILFAVLSMRQPFVTVPDQMLDVIGPEGIGLSSTNLFGFKRDAWRYTLEHVDELHADTLAASSTADQIKVLCRIPGVGIVKAGFVLQLMGYDIGCLDTRNVKREGLNPRKYRTDGRKGTPRVERLIHEYVSEVGGRASELWDLWCEDVAATYKMTPWDVSALHLTVLPDSLIPF